MSSTQSTWIVVCIARLYMKTTFAAAHAGWWFGTYGIFPYIGVDPLWPANMFGYVLNGMKPPTSFGRYINTVNCAYFLPTSKKQRSIFLMPRLFRCSISGWWFGTFLHKNPLNHHKIPLNHHNIPLNHHFPMVFFKPMLSRVNKIQVLQPLPIAKSAMVLQLPRGSDSWWEWDMDIYV